MKKFRSQCRKAQRLGAYGDHCVVRHYMRAVDKAAEVMNTNPYLAAASDTGHAPINATEVQYYG